jgi:hypothetical protein
MTHLQHSASVNINVPWYYSAVGRDEDVRQIAKELLERDPDFAISQVTYRANWSANPSELEQLKFGIPGVSGPEILSQGGRIEYPSRSQGTYSAVTSVFLRCVVGLSSALVPDADQNFTSADSGF